MLTQERVRELFDLDYETGVLTRRVDVYGIDKRTGVKIGKVYPAGESVGTINKVSGYRTLRVDGKRYLLHRVIFLHVHGYMPEGQVDHENRNRLDNRPCNLREVSQSCNMRNTGLTCLNKSGVKGVSWQKENKAWKVQIMVRGKKLHIAIVKDFTEAVARRLAAEQALDWAGCDKNSPAFQYMQNYLKSLNSELS